MSYWSTLRLAIAYLGYIQAGKPVTVPDYVIEELEQLAELLSSRPPAGPELIRAARELYTEEGAIEIDDDAASSHYYGGCWVEAWVDVSDQDLESLREQWAQDTMEIDE